MKLARVVGPVWGSRHAVGLDGAKLLEVVPVGAERGHERAIAKTTSSVAVDALGAGPGELVLVAHGSRVRDLTVGEAVAEKDIVVAIVDRYELAEWDR